ncbi:hypothetical protein [Saccharothrix xinjiangensis]|uniref:Secreted protein n=1 Tax=Saccharothrix xinjiangensis TaxID=204798 RepID=A0ABV9Y566_9PSEU
MSTWTQRVLTGTVGATLAMGALFTGSAVAAPATDTAADLTDDLVEDDTSPAKQRNQCDVVYSLTFTANKRGLPAVGKPVSDIVSSVCG